jgi:hypothetical protein
MLLLQPIPAQALNKKQIAIIMNTIIVVFQVQSLQSKTHLLSAVLSHSEAPIAVPSPPVGKKGNTLSFVPLRSNSSADPLSAGDALRLCHINEQWDF